MINIVFFSLLFFSAWTLACEVHLPSNLLILGDECNLMNGANIKDCPQEAVNELNNTLKGVEGKITSFHLVEMMKAKNHQMAVHPHLIQIQHLKHLIREQLMLPPGIHLRSSEAVNAANVVVLSPGDKVEVQCSGCLFGSRQPMNINVIGFDGSERTILVRADFKKMVKAYRMTNFHPAFSQISESSIREVFVESVPHTDLVTNASHLRFFKLNKPVRAGELLRTSDLSRLDLVRAGIKTEVIIENSHVVLKTSGISRGNGGLGEFVEVFHPQKNKKYYGKVIDINKVLVEL